MKLVALIGYGAIAKHVATALAGHEDVRLAGVIGREGALDAARAAMGPGVTVAGEVFELSGRPDLVLDCAGHSGLQAHGERILGCGMDLTSVSAGALADDALRDRLAAAARAGGARLRIAAGAIGGLDALSSAREGGLARVTYRGRKPPASWRGTPAETILDLDGLDAPRTHFRGSAREAARLYPKNANVTASIALAGIGFDATQVELIADPSCSANCHELEAEGAFGSFIMRLNGRALPDNPKSSALTAMSMVNAALSLERPILVA
jgi:aspartate dehydrogenase